MQLSLDNKKYIFCTPLGVFLGNIMCKEGLLVDPTNFSFIINFLMPRTILALRSHWAKEGMITNSLVGTLS
jgi:hypothetical protein